MTCSVVCISHTTGSGGDEVGKQVAERLGYLYVDEDIVARAAAAGGLEPADIADEERRKSYARRVLETLAEGDPSMWTTPAHVELVRPADVRALIRETVLQTAARGSVVIVAHAASHALEPGPDVLRVFVTASLGTREQRVAATDGIERSQASKTIRDSDAGRSDYLKRFYSVERESPTDYDVVVNTDRLSTGDAAEIVLHAAGR
ncbi:MAG TPA: cytidylate kinase-like family protein [Gaiellaceae bacterium]|nr:cytidylate kinase-like family protein [Gaiellaceae bacterium]